MTKRGLPTRDFVKFPFTMQESAELSKRMRSYLLQKARREKLEIFNALARKNNTEHGIRPKRDV